MLIVDGQGPSVPKVTVIQGGSVPGHENDYLYVALIGWADDADGFVRTLLLDWGDGSPIQTLPGDGLECRPGPIGWPRPSSAMLSRTPAAERLSPLSPVPCEYQMWWWVEHPGDASSSPRPRG